MTQYLLPARRQLENRMSLGAAGFGAWIFIWNLFTDYDPIGWTQMSEDARMLIGIVLIWAGALHWYGVWLNGDYRWSPLPRLIGMGCIICVWIALLSHVSHISSSAFLVYGYFAVLFLKGFSSALIDLVDAALESGHGKSTT
jgi:hypothetical protein